MRLAGISLAESIRMASINPARVGKVPGRIRGLAAGDRADLIQFRVMPSNEIEILGTWISGAKVF
jgi:N-acetylglucosamine-6-phosphate deacetylase